MKSSFRVKKSYRSKMKLLSVVVLLIFNNAFSEGSGLKGKPLPVFNLFLSEKDSVPDFGNFPEVEYPQSVPLHLQTIPFYYKANGDLDPFSEDVQATFKSITEQSKKIKEELTQTIKIDELISPTNCKENKAIVKDCKDVNIQEANRNDSVNKQVTNTQDAKESYFENNTFNMTGIVSNYKIDGKNDEDAAQIFEENYPAKNNATSKIISENIDRTSFVDSVYQNPGTETDIRQTNVSCSDNDKEQVNAILENNLNENNNTGHSDIIKEEQCETQVEKPLVLDETETLVRKKRALTSSESTDETYVQGIVINEGEEEAKATDKIINNSFNLNNITTEYNDSTIKEEYESEVDKSVMINDTECMIRAKRSFSFSEACDESDDKIKGLDDEENQLTAKIMDDIIITNDISNIKEEYGMLADNYSMFNSNETLVRKERSFTSAKLVSETNDKEENLDDENEHAEDTITESYNNITASDCPIIEEEFDSQVENPLKHNDTETLDRKKRSFLSSESVNITDVKEENLCDKEKEAGDLIVNSDKVNITTIDTSNIEENYETQAENPSMFSNSVTLDIKKRSVTSSESVSETDLININSDYETTEMNSDNNLNDTIITTSDNSNTNKKFEAEAQNVSKLNDTGYFIRRKRSTVPSELASIEDNLMQDSGATIARGFNSAETVLSRPPLAKDDDDGILIEDHNGSIEYFSDTANCDENSAIDQPDVDEEIKDL